MDRETSGSYYKIRGSSATTMGDSTSPEARPRTASLPWLWDLRVKWCFHRWQWVYSPLTVSNLWSGYDRPPRPTPKTPPSGKFPTSDRFASLGLLGLYHTAWSHRLQP